MQLTTESNGCGSGRFRTPLVPLGNYTVRATDSAGSEASDLLRVIPRIMLAPESEDPTGFRFRVYFYGYAPGDRVQIWWYEGSSYEVLKTITVAENGRASTIVYVPDDASTGDHMIRGKVIGVSRSTTTTFAVTGPGAAAEPTGTSSATASPTATPPPDSTELPTDTPSPTVEATITPIPTATPEPTATDTPTAEPAPTETPVPTEPPLPEATVSPASTEPEDSG